MKQQFNASNANYFYYYIQESEAGYVLYQSMQQAQQAGQHELAEDYKAKLCRMMQCDGWATGNGSLG